MSESGRIRAVRLRDGAAPELVLVDRPLLGPGQVRIKVAYSGICHTDLHFIDGERAARMLPEITLGHEAAGVVAELGDGVTGWAPGDRVVIQPVGERNGESWIMGVQYDGSWAEEVVVGEDALVDAGDLPFDIASIIPDAVSCPWAAITDSAAVKPGESVGVWGIGGLGYHAVQLLRLVGAVPIIAVDPKSAARERALAAGADAALDPGAPDLQERISELTQGRGLDVAFDFFGHASVQQQAFDAVGRFGRIVLVGVAATPLEIHNTPNLIRLSKRIIGHYGLGKRHVAEVIALVRSGRLDLTQSVSAIIPLEQFEEGLEALRTKAGNPIRILLDPGGGVGA